MYETGIVLGIIISILYPLSIALVLKKFKFDDKRWKYLLIAFIIGALFFFIGLIRKIYVYFIPLPTLLWIDLVVTGFIEELMKLLVILIIIKKLPADLKEAPYYGLLIGLGFGAGEMLYILLPLPTLAPAYENAIIANLIFATLTTSPLSDLFWYYVIVYTNYWLQITSVVNIFGIPLINLYERLIIVPFHATTAILIGQGFKAESPRFKLFGIEFTPKINYFLIAIGLHIVIDLFAVLNYLLVITTEIMEIIITPIALSTFIVVIWLFILKD